MYLTWLTDMRKYQEGMATHISHLFCTKNECMKLLMGMCSANRFIGSLKLYVLDNFSSGEPFINIHFSFRVWISYLISVSIEHIATHNPALNWFHLHHHAPLSSSNMSRIGSMSTRNLGHHQRDIRVAPMLQVGLELLDFKCIAANIGSLSLHLGGHPNQNGINLPFLPMVNGFPPYQVWDDGPALAPFPAPVILQPFVFPNVWYLLDYTHSYTIAMAVQGSWFRFESLDPNNHNGPRFFRTLELCIQIQHATIVHN